MKKKYFLPIASILVLFFSSSCVPDLTSPETETQGNSTLQKKSAKNKVQICHQTGSGEFVLIEVSRNSLDAHLAHGDKILDADGDGYSAVDACFGTMDDCDDNDPTVYPGAEEICGDEIDNNCNGEIDENCEPKVDADFFQGFERDKNGWVEGTVFGAISLVTSGTGGINSFGGNAFAFFNAAITGPYSSFDGIQSEWTGPWTAEIAVYLDPQWQAGEGFDYTVSASTTSGTFLRDFVFHAAKDESTGKLLIGLSQSPGFTPRDDLENLENYEITTKGWYVFQHQFYDDGGILACNLNLLDENGSVLFTKTFSNPGDEFSKNIVGGNYRSWFTNINVDGGLAVDNHSLVRE